MPFTGVSHKVGEHIDTDAIIPARFLVTTDPKKLGENCMEGLEHGWVKRVQVGDILVAEAQLRLRLFPRCTPPSPSSARA